MDAKSALLCVSLVAGCTSHGDRVATGTKSADPVRHAEAVVPAASASTAPATVEAMDAGRAAPPRRPGAYANLDPDDDLVVGPPEPYADCEAELATAGVKVRAASLPVHAEGKSKMLCGAPQVVVYVRGPGNIAYNSAPLVTCTMALALASFERILQQEASAIFGSPVARIDHIGTYSCREIAAYPGWISEHSYANAIDIGRFVLKSGKSIEVLRDFDVGEDKPAKAPGLFLRSVTRRANDEDVFSHVLTPFFNDTHKNHFHLDLARYRADGTRPR